jgi:hypothetical protein
MEFLGIGSESSNGLATELMAKAIARLTQIAFDPISGATPILSSMYMSDSPMSFGVELTPMSLAGWKVCRQVKLMCFLGDLTKGHIVCYDPSVCWLLEHCRYR